jgi:DNA modification methylase
MCVTSPPYYGLRDYGHDEQIGLEEAPDAYIAKMVEVFSEVRRVIADDGTLWLNLGDSYGPGKQLLGIPWRVALALQANGWVLRQDIIWHKPNPMPEGSAKDRCTKSHEYLFLLSKSERYFFDGEAIKEPSTEVDRPQRRRALEIARDTKDHFDAIRACGATDAGKNQITQDGFGKNAPEVKRLADEAKAALRGYYREFTFSDTKNKRSVWSIATKPYKGAHFAVFPSELVEPCILAGSRNDDTVLDPFNGSGTTGQVAIEHGRRYLGIELNPEYVELTRVRLEGIMKDKAAMPLPQLDLFAA